MTQKKSKSGEVSFGNLFIWFLLIVGLITGAKFTQAMMNKSTLQSLLTSLILQNRNLIDDPAMIEKIIVEADRTLGIRILPADVIIFKSIDGKRVRIDVSYKAPIRIQGAGFDLQMETSASEKIAFVR